MDYEHSNRLAIAMEQEFERTQRLLQQPHTYMRPKIYKDGDKWCALLGEDIQTGVCAFGNTPVQAAVNWDLVWLNGEKGTKK